MSLRFAVSSPRLLVALLGLSALNGCYDATALSEKDAGDRNNRSDSRDRAEGAEDGDTAVAPPSTTAEVCDGIDNDGDGEIDEADAGCRDAESCVDEAVPDSGLSTSSTTVAFSLPGIHDELVFADGAQLVENSDGTATLTGTLYPAGDTTRGFDAIVWLTHHTMTAPGGSPIEDLRNTAYSPSGSIDSSTWYYYDCYNASLEGIGAWVGADINLSDDGIAFQVGDGANGRNAERGASGWMTWSVASLPTSTSVGWAGAGTAEITVDLDGCEACVDLDLGAAADHNVFVFGNYTGGLDVLGSVAAGGRVDMQYFSVGSAIGSGPVLIAGTAANLDSGTVHGEVHYGTSASVPENVHVTGGTPIQGSPVDFVAEQDALEDLSLALAALAPNGDTDVSPWAEVSLVGTNPDANIFTLSGSDFVAASYLSIDAPAGATVVINVDECIINTGHFYISLEGGVDDTTVLWNFWDACWLGMEAFGMRGTVLAPFADVRFNNGNFDGNMIAASLTGTAEGHDFAFAGEGEVCE